jgi:hypothetical protein
MLCHKLSQLTPELMLYNSMSASFTYDIDVTVTYSPSTPPRRVHKDRSMSSGVEVQKSFHDTAHCSFSLPVEVV